MNTSTQQGMPARRDRIKSRVAPWLAAFGVAMSEFSRSTIGSRPDSAALVGPEIDECNLTGLGLPWSREKVEAHRHTYGPAQRAKAGRRHAPPLHRYRRQKALAQ